MFNVHFLMRALSNSVLFQIPWNPWHFKHCENESKFAFTFDDDSIIGDVDARRNDADQQGHNHSDFHFFFLNSLNSIKLLKKNLISVLNSIDTVTHWINVHGTTKESGVTWRWKWRHWFSYKYINIHICIYVYIQKTREKEFQMCCDGESLTGCSGSQSSRRAF